MRSLSILAGLMSVIGSMLVATPAANAQEYPWCAVYGKGHGGRNCGFVSYEQCMATIEGNGGFCERNLFYAGDDRPRPQTRRPLRR